MRTSTAEEDSWVHALPTSRVIDQQPYLSKFSGISPMKKKGEMQRQLALKPTP